MNHLTYEIQHLRESFIELLELVKSQLSNSRDCLYNNSIELAEDVVRTEKRVNSLEFSIEKTCENTIALFQPVATDLRFILAVFKSISELERIADHAEFVGKLVIDYHEDPISNEMLDNFGVKVMFNDVIDIHNEIIRAFENKNTAIARTLFKKDKEVNKFYREMVKKMKEQLPTSGPQSVIIFRIYSIIARVERSSNLLTNIAEEIIFYLDAEMLKHKKGKKKLQ